MVDDLKTTLEEREKTLADLQARVKTLESQVSEKTRVIAAREATIEDQSNQLNERIRQIRHALAQGDDQQHLRQVVDHQAEKAIQIAARPDRVTDSLVVHVQRSDFAGRNAQTADRMLRPVRQPLKPGERRRSTECGSQETESAAARPLARPAGISTTTRTRRVILQIRNVILKCKIC